MRQMVCAPDIDTLKEALITHRTLYLYHRQGAFHVAVFQEDHLKLMRKGWSLVRPLDPVRFLAQIFRRASDSAELQEFVLDVLALVEEKLEDEDGSDPS